MFCFWLMTIVGLRLQNSADDFTAHTHIHAVCAYCLSHWMKCVPHAILFLLASKTACSDETKCMLNTIHNRHNSFHMHNDLREIWFILARLVFFFLLLPPSSTDCRYPVRIIASINKTSTVCWKKKKKHWHITGVKCLGDDEEKMRRLFLYLCHHLANHSEVRGAALLWKVKILLS